MSIERLGAIIAYTLIGLVTVILVLAMLAVIVGLWRVVAG